MTRGGGVWSLLAEAALCVGEDQVATGPEAGGYAESCAGEQIRVPRHGGCCEQFSLGNFKSVVTNSPCTSWKLIFELSAKFMCCLGLDSWPRTVVLMVLLAREKVLRYLALKEVVVLSHAV